ncbi:MAG: UDP-3-O-(3-hydroxymyristoyl)glucosamine N-acyltransferase [bacterium]
MKITLNEIASLISGELSGSPKLVIKNTANVEDAKEGDITFAVDDKSVNIFEKSKASAAVVPRNLSKFPLKPHIKVHNLRLAMAKVLGKFERKNQPVPGIHRSALISKSAKIGSNCSIMSGVVIGDNVSIGDKVKIYPGCFIGDNCRIGKGSTLYPNVVLYNMTIVGDRCILHAGVVLGVDGFGFAPVDGKHEKIPQIGNVIIENDVEICANSCVSRATMGSTIVKRGTKIDNLSHIAHNCKIGEDCAITALVAVAGSSELGKHVSIGGTSGVVDHVKIGENTVVMARSGVTKDIPPSSVISGFPAQDHQKELEQQAALRRLPKMIEKLSEIEKLLKKQ